MIRTNTPWLAPLLALVLSFAFAFAPRAAVAADYVLGTDDVVAVSVWMHPELERTVSIGNDGTVTLAPIGDVKAAGLTPKQLADRLGDKLSSYLRQTAQVTVTVKEFLSHSVYVSGAIAKPGRYGFEHIPGLIDVITQAGGASPGADLAHVQVVRREGDARHTLTADVSSALRDGVGSNLPGLQPGDTVILPTGAAGGSVAAGDGVAVLGEVARPGLYGASGGTDLWVVLATAGGLTARGDLGNIRVVTRSGTTQAVVGVNLKDVLKNGTKSPYVVQPGDVVYVSSSGSSAFGRGFAGFTQVLALGRDVLNIVVLTDIIKRGGY